MNVQDTVKRSLLNYPTLYPNALMVYDHLFCVVGNGYMWKDGELVYHNENLVTRKSMTIKDAILSRLKEELIDDWKDKYSAKRRFLTVFTHSIKDVPDYVVKDNEIVIEDIKRILNVEKSIKDFTIPTKRLIGIKGYEFKFYGLSNYSAICCLPDDIKPDWLAAAEKMYKIMKKHIDLVDDREGWMDKIGERIKELKK